MTDVDNVVKRLQILMPKSNLSSDALITYATDAIAQATSDGFDDDQIARAASLIGAHYALLSINGSNNIKSQAAGPLSVTYKNSIAVSDYLTEYIRLKDALSSNDKNIAQFL